MCTVSKKTDSPPLTEVLEALEVEEEDGGLNPRVTDQWVGSHAVEDRLAVTEALNGQILISHKDFVLQLQKSIASVQRIFEKLYGQRYSLGDHCVVLIEDRKSNLWVADLAANIFGFEGARYMDLGLNCAEKFHKMLDDTNKDLETVRNKFEDKTIVLFDDASYSGEQMSGHVRGVRQAILEYKLKIKKIVVVVPFATPYAMKKIMKATTIEDKRLRGDVFIAPSAMLPMLSDLEYFPTLAKLWYKGDKKEAEKISLARFSHKTPNYQSFPAALASGSVYHLDSKGMSSSQKKSWGILTKVETPYKGSIGERFPTADDKRQ